MQIYPGGNLMHLLDPIVQRVFWQQYNRIPAVTPLLYNMRTSSDWRERMFAVGSLGEIPEFNGTLEYDTFEGLWAKDITHKRYAKGLEISNEIIEDDRFNIAIQKPQGLATAAAYTREKQGAGLFNDAFDTTTTADGSYLCVATHPYSPTNTTTQSNLATGVLTHDNVVAARLAMRSWVDDRGKKILINPDTLIVPPALEEAAWMIAGPKTEYIPGQSNYDLSIFANWNLRVVVWPFLTSDTAWFLVDSNLMRDNLVWYDRVPLSLTPRPERDFDTLALRWRLYGRWSYGTYGWRWIYGSTGAG